MTTRTARPARFPDLLVRAGLLAVAWVMCLLPLQVRAQAVRPPGTPAEGGCSFGSTYVPGGGLAAFNQEFVPARLNMKRNSQVGEVVYSVPLPTIPWACGAPANTSYGTPKLVTRNDYVVTANALDSASLGLRLVLNVGTWTVLANDAGVVIGKPWAKRTPGVILPQNMPAQNGLLSGRLELFIVRPIDRPLSVNIPLGPGLFRIVPGGTFDSPDQILIGSTLASTQAFLIPDACLVKVAVPNTVDLGFVYPLGNLPLPAPRSFNVNVAFDPGCEGFGDSSNWRGFILPLKITFSTPDAVVGGQAISLRNSDGSTNGLNLVLKQGGAIPVAFNREAQTDPLSLIAGVRPAMNLPYTAEVVKNGAQIITGKFSQQVVVKVTYF
ncbi:fimbrial protein [Achromobacter insuavis]|uniref:fimbrial protein n=1 Tax=Achromobacter insuavis TaxID=1287735 RepID=UPI0013C2F7D4|nr:fimbrial protein [Achromobacter insuavis]